MNSVPRARLFRRDDRDQLADLVNAHLAAVIPGARVSVNTVLSALERQPEEYVVDPWVTERVTIVVEVRDRIVAAAHLQRFADDPRVSDDYRRAGLIQWALAYPGDAGGPGDAGDDDRTAAALDAADLLLRACLAQLQAWAVAVACADGQLPYPGVYGVPAQWPHVRDALARAGFVWDGAQESILLATPQTLPAVGGGFAARSIRVERTLGAAGARFTAYREEDVCGFVEVDLTAGRTERLASGGVVAEIADWDAAEAEILTRILVEVREWLELSGVRHLLAATDPDDAEEARMLDEAGFREVTTTARGWRLNLR